MVAKDCVSGGRAVEQDGAGRGALETTELRSRELPLGGVIDFEARDRGARAAQLLREVVFGRASTISARDPDACAVDIDALERSDKTLGALMRRRQIHGEAGGERRLSRSLAHDSHSGRSSMLRPYREPC